jgi:hypothetical protein
MGYGIFPDLTDGSTICKEACEHTDCAYWRKVDKACALCGKQVVASQKFYMDGERFMHDICVWEKVKEDQIK